MNNTPLVNALIKYNKKKTQRYHMPGHKGRAQGFLKSVSKYDVTELCETDNLYTSCGSIYLAEQLCAKAFGVSRSLFCASGATGCIMAMLFCFANKKVIFDSGVHKSVIDCIGLFNITPVFTRVEFDKELCVAKTAVPEEIEKALIQNSDASAVFVTGENYYGYVCDYEKISLICKKANVKLLVDNAHGTHLKFYSDGKLHPSSWEVAMFCDSAHKSTPALTGGAYLHINSSSFSAEVLKKNMNICLSSSPSYLIMASLDYARSYLENTADYNKCAKRKKQLEYKIEQLGYTVLKDKNYDECRLVVNTRKKGYNAKKLADYLYKNKIVCEMADTNNIVFLISEKNSKFGYKKLLILLSKYDIIEKNQCEMIDLTKNQAVYPVSKAIYMQCEPVPLEKAVNKICASTIYAYPPASALCLPGEIISEQLVNYLKAIGETNNIFIIKQEE